MKTLDKYLKNSARKWPDKRALIMKVGYRYKNFTFKELLNFAQKIAVFMKQQGVKKGDRVLILSPSSPYWVSVFWACVLMGVVAVPLNVQSSKQEIKHILDQTKAKLFFKFMFFKQDVPKKLKCFDIELLEELVEDVDISKFKANKPKEEDLVEIMYTSGTTGDPKGVMLSHKNLHSCVEGLANAIPFDDDDRILSILPLSHIFEQSVGMLLPIKLGLTIVYTHSPIAINSLLNEFQITKMVAVPEFLHLLMSKIEAKAAWMIKIGRFLGFKSLKRLFFWPVLRKIGGKLSLVASGGAPLDPQLEKKWRAMGVDLLQGYGLTETSPVLTFNTFKENKIGSVGKAAKNVKLKISKDGTVLAKGPNVFKGYYKNSAKTKEVFTKDGWFDTGDGGEIDKDGFLFLKGRKKYMILGSGGQNIYPEDMEQELNKILGIRDSCVVGLEKEAGLMEIHAAVLTEGRINMDNIIKKVNEHLASYQQIQSWSIWPQEDFPRSATRKVKKQLVIDYLQSKGAKAAMKAGIEDKSKLIHLLAEVTQNNVGKINNKTKIVPELGLDSLLRLELVARIEEKFRVTIEESKITNKLTVSGLQRLINKTEPFQKRWEFKKWLLAPWLMKFRSGVQFLLFSLFRVFSKFELEGVEKLKNLELPAIFMPNHLCSLDATYVAMALPKKIRKKIAFAAAADVLYGEFKNIKFIPQLAFATFPLPRKENTNIREGLDIFGKTMDQGFSVIVFPEGHMSKDGQMQKFKKGSGLMATSMDSYIVPMKIKGTNDIFPYAKLFPRHFGKVSVKFGEPVKYSRADSVDQVTKDLEKRLNAIDID